jgi:hypothetical protein
MPNKVAYYEFRGARVLISSKGQLEGIQRIAELTGLSSEEDHKVVLQAFSELGWETEKSVFPVKGYRLDAYKCKTGVEVERSLIDAVHRSLFRCTWAYRNGFLDVLVFIIPFRNNEINFNNIKRDLEAFSDAIPYPVYLIGVGV